MTDPAPTPHPATFSDDILETIRQMVFEERMRLGRAVAVLDPFAGVGGIHQLLRNPEVFTYGLEIEPEWASQHPGTRVGSALNMGNWDYWGADEFDIIATSPCYGNRMADTYDGRDGSSRRTYRISLGRMPSEGSSAMMQWGDAYRVFHRRAWAECTRVTTPNAIFILNIKDHWRKGRWQNVPGWHRVALRDLGWDLEETVEIDSGRGYGFGQNMHMKKPELVMRFRKRELGF